MEDSSGSLVSKAGVASKGTELDSAAQEESGWTAYFDDFYSNQMDQEQHHDDHHHHQEHRSSSDHHHSHSFGSPSLVTDADSSAPWKLNNSNNNQFPMPKKLPRIKKMIARDDSLEDTASSPVNSPEVSRMKQVEFNLRRREDNNIESYLGKGGNPMEMAFGSENHESGELKKKGLCLVPLSMLVNYIV